MAAVAGAVVGAGVAIAGAVALSDEKNQEKVKKVLSTVKDGATEYIKNAQDAAEEEKDMATKKIEEVKKEVKKSLSK